MSNEDLQREEMEVLDSMYAGDQSLTVIDSTKFQIKIEDLEGEPKQHIFIEFEFTPNYPAEAPIFKLDLAENEKLSVKGRQAIIDNLNEQVATLLDMPMIYTLVEHLRSNFKEIITPHIHTSKNLWEAAQQKKPEAPDSKISATQASTSGKKEDEPKEKLTKAQKRRLGNQIDIKTGEKPRGWNWVDVIAHLSKTG